MTKILLLSWRDIKSPNAGGAEVNTHEMLKRLNPKKYYVVHISPLYKNLKEKELIDGIMYLRHGNIFSVILFAIKYYKKYRNDFDYIIDQCNTHRFFTSLWVEKNKRIFLIYQLTRDIWDINLRFPISKIGKILENPLLRMNKNDITITESESTKKDLIEVGFCKDNIFVVPIIMKIKPWNISDFLEKAVVPQYVYVGRYVKYKGIDIAVEAIGLLKADGIKAQLVILGKKNEEYIGRSLLPICDRYGLEIFSPEKYDVYQADERYRDADIVFAGFVSEEDKLKTLSKAKALVFPSNREGWGIPISEAAYVGTPSVVFNTEGLIDAVDYGQAGFVSKEKTAFGICEQMKITLKDSELYEQMRINAYRFSKEYLDFDVEQVLGRILNRDNSRRCV